MQTQTTGFTPETVKFLRQLKRNNDRRWFEKNRARYEGSIREPSRLFIDEIRKPLLAAFPGLRVDYRAISRLHRDVRFSEDKSPYKTWSSFRFVDPKAKKSRYGGETTPSIHIGFDPSGILIGCGMYDFKRPFREHFRERITNPPTDASFRKAIARAKHGGFEPNGKTLKRIPPGYPPKHPSTDFLLHSGLYLTLEMDMPDAFYGSPREFARFILGKLSPCRSFFAWMQELARTAPKDPSRFLSLDRLGSDPEDFR